jgi:translation initiation factor IF-2
MVDRESVRKSETARPGPAKGPARVGRTSEVNSAVAAEVEVRQLRPTVVARRRRAAPSAQSAQSAPVAEQREPRAAPAQPEPGPAPRAERPRAGAQPRPAQPRTETAPRVARPSPQARASSPSSDGAARKTGVEIWQGRPGVSMTDWRAQALRRDEWKARASGAAPSASGPLRPRTVSPAGLSPAPAPAARGSRPVFAGRGPAGRGTRPATPGGRFGRRPPQRSVSAKPIAPPTERAAHKRVVKIDGGIGVASLAATLGVKAPQVLLKLMALGAQGIHLNSTLDVETASLVAAELGWSVENTAVTDAELVRRARPVAASATRVRRAPVVTVMGHVDHGKTTLLDRIRQADVAAHEAGGITQHIGAYATETPRGRITFIDTPGHAAFSALRARGARVTDLVILVVAADDGIMPQTRDALEQARAARVPVVVAINKIDKPGADPARLRQELAGLELVPEEWGGDTLFAEISALSGQGVPELLDKVLLQAELLELEASPDQAASGVVLEARLDKGKGPLATLLIKDGTLHARDLLVAGNTWGKVRALFDERGRALESAGPGTPVTVFGLSELPRAGDLAEVVASAEAAREITERRQTEERQRSLGAQSAKASLLDLARFAKAPAPELRLVLKADTDSSLDALRVLLAGLPDSPVKLRVVHTGIGAISESDVQIAAAGSARIVGFNVGNVGRAATLAQQQGVEITLHGIIYELADDIERQRAAVLGPTVIERELGTAEVLQVFRAGTSRAAGARVTSGLVRRGARVQVIRAGALLWQGGIASLRRLKDDVREVREGLELGLVLNGFEAFEVGDVLRISEVEEVPFEVRRAS